MEIRLFEKEVYVNRRSKLASKIGSGQVLLLGNKESSINFKDNWYPFRQDSSFLYYTGINVPNLCLIIDVDNDKSILIGNELTMDDIIWTGPLPSLSEMAENVGIQEVHPISKLKDLLKPGFHFIPAYRPEHQITLSKLTGQSIEDLNSIFSEKLVYAIESQRSHKEKVEIESLHEACTRTAEMHLAVMKGAKPGMHEFDLITIAQQVASKFNSRYSFQPICTIKGHILHNHSYHNKIKDGQLVLFDGGLESSMYYAGDLTRTFPVSRKFSSLQNDIYQIVLNAQKTAIRSSTKGAYYRDVHMKACIKIAEGMIDLGFMKGDPEEAAAAGAHTLVFQHGLGHFMGLDVHDMENLGEDAVGYGKSLQRNPDFGFKSLRLAKPLEPGNTITIEPGIYIIPALIEKFEAEGKFKDFVNYSKLKSIGHFSGVRIEDDYLITENGIELLGEPLAKEVKEVEEIRQAALS